MAAEPEKCPYIDTLCKLDDVKTGVLKQHIKTNVGLEVMAKDIPDFYCNTQKGEGCPLKEKIARGIRSLDSVELAS